MDTNEPRVNIPLLRKAVEWVEEQDALRRRGDPSEWDQSVYISKIAPGRRIETPAGEWLRVPECGTVCCVAGHIAMQAGMAHAFVSNDSFEFAAGELGIDTTQALDLFKGSNSAADVRRVAERIAGEPL